MTQHKIVKIPDWVIDDQAYLNEVGAQGWELIHLYNQHAYMKASDVGTIASGSLSVAVDAFGRQRVSETQTLADYKHLYAIDFNFLDYTASGGNITFDVNRSSVILATSASASSRAVHQSKMYHNYMPGKSQLILSSVVFGAAQAGVTKRTGYFDDHNGIFVEQDATGSLNWVIRSATNGTASIQENRVSQNNWNVNKVNGGDLTLDITKSQLFWIDFQWLAVGRVRCGIVHQGAYVLCHVFDHSNYTNVAYMSNPNLPVRCEIQNSTTTTGSMEQICSTVMSEGGYVESGTTWALTSPALRVIPSGSTIPVIAIRLKNSYNGLPNRAFIRVSNMTMISTDQTVKYRLVKLPASSSLTGGSWVSVNAASTAEYNATATTGSAATERELLNGFVYAGGTGVGNATSGISSTAGVETKINYIAQNYNSTDSELYAIMVTNLTSSPTSASVGITWKEVF